MSDEPSPPSNAEAWEARYASAERVWSGNPNALLVEHVGAIAVPAGGRALELGCGEGADAIWLARQGWQVLATDIARSGLRKAAEHAAEAGVASSIEWAQYDLAEAFPDGEFGLVGSAYLHSMIAIRARRSCAARRRRWHRAACSTSSGMPAPRRTRRPAVGAATAARTPMAAVIRMPRCRRRRRSSICCSSATTGRCSSRRTSTLR